MAYFTLSDGVPLYYREAGSGPTVVLLQGLTWTSDAFWQRNFDQLAKTNHVIAIDMRGQGRSGKPLSGYSIDQCAADMHEAFAALDLQHITLVGLAFGVLTSLAYFRDFGSDRIVRLVLMEGTPRLKLADDWEHATFGSYDDDAHAGFLDGLTATRQTLADFMFAAFAAPPTGDTLAELNAEAYQTPTQVALDYINDMGAQDLRHVLPDIDVPTLLIYGRKHNPVMPGELGAWLETQIPGARLVRFENSGHSPFWDEAERFNDLIAEFAHD